MKRLAILIVLTGACLVHADWDPDKPADNRALDLRDDDCRANFSALESGIGPVAAVFNVMDATYGAAGDGSTDDTAAIQAAIDAAITAEAGSVYLPPGDYMIDGTLYIYSTVSFGGAPGAGARWNQGGSQHIGVRIIGASDSAPTIFVGGLATSDPAWQTQGVYLHDFEVVSETPAAVADGGTSNTLDGYIGICFNGSTAGKLPNANRLYNEDILIERVSVRNFTVNNYRFEGNNFDVRLNECCGQVSGEDCVETVTVDSSGVDHPGQMQFHNCYFSSNLVDTWAVDLGVCSVSSFIGGGISGTGNGVNLGSYATVFGGTNFEGLSGTNNNIAIRIMGQGVTVGGISVTGWDVGLQIGNSSTENCGGWKYLGGYLNAADTGLYVTAGGGRVGTFMEPSWGTPTTKITDERWTTDGAMTVNFVSDNQAITSFTSDTTPDAYHRKQMLLTGTADITDFDNAYEGQELTCILGSNTIDFTHNAAVLDLQDDRDWNEGLSGDAIGFISRNGVWRETFRSAETEKAILTKATDLTNAQIKALRATPIELVAAPGAGKLIEFISAYLVLDYGTNVLTESDDNLVIEYDDGGDAAASQTIEMTGFIDSAADAIINALPTVNMVDAAADIVNENLALVNTGDGEFGGNAAADTAMRVIVTYRIIDTLGL